MTLEPEHPFCGFQYRLARRLHCSERCTCLTFPIGLPLFVACSVDLSSTQILRVWNLFVHIWYVWQLHKWIFDYVHFTMRLQFFWVNMHWITKISQVYTKYPVPISEDIACTTIFGNLKMSLYKETWVWWDLTRLRQYVGESMIPRGLRIKKDSFHYILGWIFGWTE